jgi:hypothetical protein
MIRHSAQRPAVLILTIILIPILLTGCKDSPSVPSVRWELEQLLPGARFERETHVRLGRLSMALAKPIVRWALDEDDEARAIVANIKRVDVGVYRVVSLPDSSALDLDQRFEQRLAAKGWTMVVRQKDETDRTWVFTREDDKGRIRSLFVAALDEAELTLVSLDGRLDRVIAEALADEPGELVEILGS